MQDDQRVIFCLVDIHFQHVCACLGCFRVGIKCVFREVGDTTAVSKIQWICPLHQPRIRILSERLVTGGVIIGDRADNLCLGRYCIVGGAEL